LAVWHKKQRLPDYIEDGTVTAGDRLENVKELRISVARNYGEQGLEGFEESC